MTAIGTRGSTRATDPTRPAGTASGTAPRAWRRYRARDFYLFTAPWILGLVLLTAFPLAFALWMSFTDYDGLTPGTEYVGLSNYTRAFSDPTLRQSLLVTAVLMLVVVPLTVAFGLVMALLVNQPLRERSAYRAVLYLPAVIPVTAGGIAFRMVFDQNVGPVNGVLSALGLDIVPWLTDWQALWVLLAFMLWGSGASMVISLAALQGVPTELLEAAEVDGASAGQRVRRIVLPIISPMLLFQVITGVIGAIQMFVPALLMGNSTVGVASSGDVPTGLRVYMLYVYQTYFGNAEFGYASAMLWLLFLFICAVTALVFLGSRRFVFYETSDGDDR